MLGILAICAAASFNGCAPNVYHRNSSWNPNDLLNLRLVGRWSAEGYAGHDPQPVFRDELQFNRDDTFSYSRVWPNHPNPIRHTRTGYWTISEGQLVQYWPRPRGQGYRTTTSTILETRPREIVIQNGVGPATTYFRQPRPDQR